MTQHLEARHKVKNVSSAKESREALKDSDWYIIDLNDPNRKSLKEGLTLTEANQYIKQHKEITP